MLKIGALYRLSDEKYRFESSIRFQGPIWLYEEFLKNMESGRIINGYFNLDSVHLDENCFLFLGSEMGRFKNEFESMWEIYIFFFENKKIAVSPKYFEFEEIVTKDT